jgi:hypothetical protein
MRFVFWGLIGTEVVYFGKLGKNEVCFGISINRFFI